MVINACLRCFARVVLSAFGSFRIEKGFPWFSTATHESKITIDEAASALTRVRYGDIGLSRRDWYLSNLIIPGAMKHVWLHTHDATSIRGRTGGLVIEATRDRVHHRHALYPLRSDYAVILRPRGLTVEQLKGSGCRAQNIKYLLYGQSPEIDPKHNVGFYERPAHLDAALDELYMHAAAFRKWERGFTPAEAIAYCFWHVRETLKIRRSPFGRHQVIVPQDFLSFNFDIIWASNSLTLNTARRMGFNDVALDKLAKYLQGHRT